MLLRREDENEWVTDLNNKKILVCDPIHEDGIKMLKEAGFKLDLSTAISKEELIKNIKAYDAMIVRSRTKVTVGVLSAGNKLKVIARAGVGLDNIDIEAAKKRCVKVVNSPEA